MVDEASKSKNQMGEMLRNKIEELK